jgi:hypothetical protein
MVAKNLKKKSKFIFTILRGKNNPYSVAVIHLPNYEWKEGLKIFYLQITNSFYLRKSQFCNYRQIYDDSFVILFQRAKMQK